MILKLSLMFYLLFVSYCFCEECSLHYKPIPESKKQLLNRISLLNSQRFVVVDKGFTYAVTICSEVSKNYPNAAAARSFNTDKNTTVIGRLNDTHIVGGSDWILLTYASGDVLNHTDHGHNKSITTSLMITCNRESDQTLFLLEDDDIEGDCQVTFSLRTSVVCPNNPKGLSGGSVFCVLLLTGAMMYLIIGVAYRRIMTGAQGLEQIPNYHFWRNLGNLQADGCDFVCRKGAGRDEPWNRITSNFNDPADEPLLHP
ncbi:cation-dependent mannose-6-phosphate receptor-like [Macrosteles quadrilineatus]|uniref:cation-dependent mannose-6-phosphate receptor-like n=1 Tax=Macrosteles quadrilineatus TaxID=74068 RepID=UPI0023E2697C|nr:cation-dependent mannose-6-phosphate receptor-like [Macrosteles quadrilineatus]XP_054271769.1 cation-dependent mannose-6-phosphate receptor-like [Macrosteles quadrilineatus]